MKILVAVDASGSFVCSERWEHTKKIVNETVKALEKTSEVEIVKVRLSELVPVLLEEFNEGWDCKGGDGGGMDETQLNGLDYDKVLFITDGFVDQKVLKDNIALMIVEDTDYENNSQSIVGFHCELCGKEKGLHKAQTYFCPTTKGYFSRTDRFVADLNKPIRRFTI